jgi:hypothetical protein
LGQRAFREGLDGTLGGVQRCGGAHDVLVVGWFSLFVKLRKDYSHEVV